MRRPNVVIAPSASNARQVGTYAMTPTKMADTEEIRKAVKGAGHLYVTFKGASGIAALIIYLCDEIDRLRAQNEPPKDTD